MSRNRATQAELIQRREEIQQLILSGMTSTQIQEQMSVKWETSKRAIAEDMRVIADEWEDKASENTQLMRNKYEARLEMLFNRALLKDQIKSALEIQKELSKLNGLYKDKEDLENNVPKFVNVSRRNDLKVVGGNEDE